MAASSSKTYPGIPLNLETPSIRLLSFWRSEIDATVICGCLETFELSKCPPFMALSYEWGEASPAHHIELHGKAYPIRRNLYTALGSIIMYMETEHSNSKDDDDSLQIAYRDMKSRISKIRVPDGDVKRLRYFWIDAICIDQENTAERNHQLNLMKGIYRNATLVIAWLGSSNQFNTRAMALFRKYRDMHPYSVKSLLRTDRWHMKAATISTNYLLARYGFLFDFLSQEYFHRMWIVQELALARRSIFMCEKETIDTSIVHSCVRQISEDLTPSPGWKILNAKHELGGAIDMLFLKFKHCKCMDARDRLYALSSIASPQKAISLSLSAAIEGLHDRSKLPEMQMKFTADYGMSPFEVLIQCFQQFMIYGVSYFREALRFPEDFVVLFDAYEPTVHMLPQLPVANKITNVNFGNPRLISTRFLYLIRSLDWVRPDKWSENYQVLKDHRKTDNGRAFMKLTDLLTCSPFDLYNWAAGTLRGHPIIDGVE